MLAAQLHALHLGGTTLLQPPAAHHQHGAVLAAAAPGGAAATGQGGALPGSGHNSPQQLDAAFFSSDLLARLQISAAGLPVHDGSLVAAANAAVLQQRRQQQQPQQQYQQQHTQQQYQRQQLQQNQHPQQQHPQQQQQQQEQYQQQQHSEQQHYQNQIQEQQQQHAGAASGRRRGPATGSGSRRNEDKVRRTVYISDISDAVTEAQLAVFFRGCGQLVDCRVCGDPNSSMRFAFIEFQGEEAAQQVGAGRAG